MNGHRTVNTDTVLTFIYRAVAVTHILLGLAIMIGGKAHFPFPTYQPLLDLSQGAVWPWGVTIIAAGVLMLIPRAFAGFMGLLVGFLWMNLFASMFVVALIQYDGAGSTAPIPYALIAFIQVALLTLKVAEWRRRRDGG